MRSCAAALLLAGCSTQNPGFYVDSNDGGLVPTTGVETSGSSSSSSGGAAATTEEPTGPGRCEGRGDADADGVCDDLDICAGGDDSLDSDGDGTPDLCDICVLDPEDDLDGDGVCGESDVCPAGDDAADGDGDGQADACDPCPQDKGDDGDGDGVCDGVDLCPGANDELDMNLNGVPDGCDPCPADAMGDGDGDGVCDGQDKCQGFDDKLETDMDGVPDGCDPCPNDPTNDGDGDGVCDDLDNCVGAHNPEQSDGDGDGHGDPCDVCKWPSYSDDDADYDGDGIPCAQDPCLFDGPTPPAFPGSVGPHQEITISGAKINNGGAFGVVAPNAPVNLKYQWKANFCACETCVHQGMVGLVDYPPTQCFFAAANNKPNCKNQSGNADQTFTAPAQPGTYFFRYRRTQEYYCKKDSTLEDPETEFAAICVK